MSATWPSVVLAVCATLSFVNVVVVGWIVWSIRRVAMEEAAKLLAPMEREHALAIEAQATARREALAPICAALKELGDEVRGLYTAQQVMRAGLEQAPTLQAMHDLGLRLERVTAMLEASNESQARILRMVERHEEIITDAARDAAPRRQP